MRIEEITEEEYKAKNNGGSTYGAKDCHYFKFPDGTTCHLTKDEYESLNHKYVAGLQPKKYT